MADINEDSSDNIDLLISIREFDIIIAALRLYAGQLARRNDVNVASVEEIATNGGVRPAPTSEEVYDLGDELLN